MDEPLDDGGESERRTVDAAASWHGLRLDKVLVAMAGHLGAAIDHFHMLGQGPAGVQRFGCAHAKAFISPQQITNAKDDDMGRVSHEGRLLVCYG